MARRLCLTLLAFALPFALLPGDAPAKKKRGVATAKRCAVKKSPRPRACRSRSYSSWQLMRERRSRPGLVDLTPRWVAPGPSGPTPTGSAGGPAPVYSRFASVRATEFAFSLSRPVVGAGQVTLQLQNRGEDPHNLKLSTGPGQAPLTGIADQDPGGVAETSPTLGAGTYYLFCSLGDHESRGMHANLEVR